MAPGSELADAIGVGTQAACELTRLIGQGHRALAGRAFRAAGPAGHPAHLLHDAIAVPTYAAVRLGLRTAGSGGELVARHRPTGPALTAGRRSGRVVAAVNGAFGDHVAARRPALDLGLAIRDEHAGVVVAPTRAALAGAFPHARPDVAVFLHGLCEDDTAWGFGAPDGERRYATSLAAADVTPVFLRYNTGRHISDNGDALDDLLEAVVAGWPVPVRRLMLVGHSMGGLVIRSAAHRGLGRAATWVPLVRQVVYLGTPHAGAPLERVAAQAVVRLRRLPETLPIATGIAARSVGIKDLRHGSLLAADWAGLDPDVVGPDACAAVGLLPDADHHVVAATLTRDPAHPVGRILGDLLVQQRSAHGEHRAPRATLAMSETWHLAGRHHFHLLNDPTVADHLARWARAPR